jgi:hypothetical protein
MSNERALLCLAQFMLDKKLNFSDLQCLLKLDPTSSI